MQGTSSRACGKVRSPAGRARLARRPPVFVAVCSAIVLTASPTVLAAQLPDSQRYVRGSVDNRDLRLEGILDYWDVGVGQLALKSAMIDDGTTVDDVPTGQFALWFFVPEGVDEQPLEIRVEDRLGLNYFMTPQQTKWARGTQSFVWDDDEPRSHGLGPMDLLVVARTRTPQITTTIVPVAISTADPPGLMRRYQFVLVASRTVTVQAAIYDEEGTVLHEETFRGVAPNEDLVMTWDAEGAAPGVYDLVVDYTFVSGLVENFQDVYTFYHREVGG